MCGSQLERLKRAIEERRINNLSFSKTGSTDTVKSVFEGSAMEDKEIIHMIEILERSG